MGHATQLVRRAFTSSLVMDEHQGPGYYWLLAWCTHYLPAASHVLALHVRREVEYGPAPGLYMVRYEGRRILVEREEYSAGPAGEGRTMTRLRLTLLGRHQALFGRILAEGEQLFHPKDGRISITVQAGGYWDRNYREPSRTLESVLLDADVKQDIVSDLAEFLRPETEAWYHGMHIPYTRGYLLHGPPGNGKTSLLRALASHFDLPLYVLNLADPKVDDSNLAAMLQSVGRGIVLLEDLDAVLPGREVAGESRALTFTGVLNALDGVLSSNGRILFASSNHPELLDPALVRPGRIDKRVLIDNASGSQAAELFGRFFPGDWERREVVDFELHGRRLSMATVQGALLSNRHNAHAAVLALLALHRDPPPASVRAYVPATQTNNPPAMPAPSPRVLTNSLVR